MKRQPRTGISPVPSFAGGVLKDCFAEAGANDLLNIRSAESLSISHYNAGYRMYSEEHVYDTESETNNQTAALMRAAAMLDFQYVSIN